MGRGAWWNTVYGVAKSRTRLSTHMTVETELDPMALPGTVVFLCPLISRL